MYQSQKTYSYCKKGDPNRTCRFKFPKPYSPVTEKIDDDHYVYKRDVTDCNVNNYNPYLLATFRTSMDIQYNNGAQAVRYLAKYLAKDDYEARILLKSAYTPNCGYYQKSSMISDRDHFSTRIVGAIEATYDLMGWHKQQSSRQVIFINTNLIGHDSRAIKSKADLAELDDEDEDIYVKTHVRK